jgi:hypothetical protein
VCFVLSSFVYDIFERDFLKLDNILALIILNTTTEKSGNTTSLAVLWFPKSIHSTALSRSGFGTLLIPSPILLCFYRF